MVTLLGMWLFPVIFAVRHMVSRRRGVICLRAFLTTAFFLKVWKLIITWLVFSATTAYITYRATRQPLPVTTPRYAA